MQLRGAWLVHVIFAFVAFGCGDNIHKHVGDDGGVDDGMMNGDAIDGPTDARMIDGPPDATPDATPDAACNLPSLICNGVCTDVVNDNMHCGSCNTDCTLASKVCATGICCNSGEINDNGHCCPTGDHYDNGICCPTNQVNTNGICCASGQINSNGICCATGQHEDGGICCNSGESNTGGICCPTGDINCSGTCQSPTSSDTSCGGCPGMGGTDCTLTSEKCQGGICCPVGQVNTGGICCLSTQFNVMGICCNSAADLNCGGTCQNPLTSNVDCGGCVGAGGADCTATSKTCSSGICCASGTQNTNGICCTATQHNSSGICCGPGTDNTGGICCASGKINANGICCNPGQSNCGGVCVDENTDENNCGACLSMCTSSQTCLTGHCCANGDNLCNNACSDPQNDDTNCGGCAGAGGTNCTTTSKVCSSGICCPSGQHNDGGICCAAGKVNVGGICCNSGQSNCSGVCVNEQNDPNHCGSCTKVCGSLETCNSGNCDSTCSSPNTACPNSTPPVCTDLTTDDANCGTCGNICMGGQSCVTSSCMCPSTEPDLCPPTSGGTCIDPQTDPNNCGGCAGTTGMSCGAGQTCDTGHCCSTGTQYCAGTNTCANVNNDINNCGSCGNACVNGAVCNNGSCQCPFGEISCSGGCKVATTDNNNCGSCGNVCGSGVNAGKPYCVSNGCVAACPSPLVACGGKCINPLTDNQNCGSCGGTDCTATGKVCTDGQCGTEITTTGTPSKCVGAGPPIVVPGSGGDVCTGNLANVEFTFGLCSCTDIGPGSQLLQTDAFDSSIGPYVGPGWNGTACNTASDCGKSCSSDKAPCAQSSNCAKVGHCSVVTTTACNINGDCGLGETCISGQSCTRYPIACVNHTCTGGGVGTNGTQTSSASTNVGGDLWAYSTAGVEDGKDVTILRRLYDNGLLKYGKPFTIYGDAHVHGGFSGQGAGTAEVGKGPVSPDTGTLYEQTTACSSLPSDLTLDGTPKCTQQTVTFAKPCACDSADLVPVKTIVHHFSIAANNDNAAAGISPTALQNPGNAVRLDLQCGYYYFTQITGAKPITIVVHGHVGIFVSGSIDSSQGIVFDLDPTATLDVFAGGVINVSGNTAFGSPAYPRYTRMYVGSASCQGGSGACSANEDCCGGVCTGGFCVGGGGNVSQAISMSNTGKFSGLLWAGYGTVTHSNDLEMYGAIFSNHFDASGPTKIHYDGGIVLAPNECVPPSGSCDSCSDCGNQPCVAGQCQSTCSSDNQCCPPLHCDNGAGGTNKCTL